MTSLIQKWDPNPRSWQAVKQSTAYWRGLDLEKVERHLAELKDDEAKEVPFSTWELEEKKP